MTKVAITGVGHTEVGKHRDRTLEELFVDASRKAIGDAGVDSIDGLYVGNMLSIFSRNQGHLAPYLADKIGFPGVHAVSTESACASGGVALAQGVMAVKSGLLDDVLVGGVEKMSGMETPDATWGLTFAEDLEHVRRTGVSFAGLNAMLARLYMKTHGLRHEDIARFSVQCHDNGLTADHAQLKKKITVEDALSSPVVADPLRLFDACPISDGAAVVVLQADSDGTDGSVEIVASSVATQTMSLHERKDMLSFKASQLAAGRAQAQAGIGLEEIDFVEVHDAFNVTGLLSLESMGFFSPGKSTYAVQKGETSLDGRLPVNTFGGLKARGHPVGATGLYQTCEAVLQLRGEAGSNQIMRSAVYGLLQNVGAVDSTSAVNILRGPGT
ncbi:MAG: beta-ketoacyl synthase N-terminal-like domain-containing protein [Candidatus Geothermarchaeales archaeon]